MLPNCKIQVCYLNKEMVPYLLIYSISPLLIEHYSIFRREKEIDFNL